MLGFGFAAIHIYLFLYRVFNNEPLTPTIELLSQDPVSSTAESAPFTFATFVTAAISTLAALGLIALIVKLYNNHMRTIIARLAHLFKAQIFTVEVIGTLIAWTIATLSVALIIPAFAILATFAFIINELLFIFAWGAYGQPNYRI